MSQEPNKKPSKNALTASDKIKLLSAVADLPFVHRTPKNHDFMRDLMLTVLDFHMLAEVVGKAIDHFRYRVQPVYDIETLDDLTQTLERFPDTREGNTDASLFFWNNRHWQRAHLLRGLLAYFESIGVTDQPELRRWASTAVFERDFEGKVRGLGLAVFQWLLIRSGVKTLKPDVWVFNYAHRITGKKLADTALIEIFDEISHLVGESMVTIDMTIWASERMGLGTNDAPGLRLVWWLHVWRKLEERFQSDESFRDGNWHINAARSDRVRYGNAEILMVGMMRLRGDDKPVETFVSLIQSGWLERFRLSLTLMRDLPENGADQMKAHMEAATWIVTVDGAVKASMDLDTSLLMPPTLSIEKLMESVDKITEKTVAAVKAVLA